MNTTIKLIKLNNANEILLFSSIPGIEYLLEKLKPKMNRVKIEQTEEPIGDSSPLPCVKLTFKGKITVLNYNCSIGANRAELYITTNYAETLHEFIPVILTQPDK